MSGPRIFPTVARTKGDIISWGSIKPKQVIPTYTHVCVGALGPKVCMIYIRGSLTKLSPLVCTKEALSLPCKLALSAAAPAGPCPALAVAQAGRPSARKAPS